MGELKCPERDQPIPPTGASSATGVGTGGGEVAWQPSKSHTEYPGCGAKLERMADDPDAPWQVVR